MILILNFGGQYCHLIARRVRDFGVASEIAPSDITAEQISQLKPEGIILSGGPASVYDEKAPLMDSSIFNLGIPILGICYGAQLIGKHIGAKVSHSKMKEFGSKHITITTQGKLLKGLTKTEQVWMSHADIVTELPKGFSVLASTNHCPIAAFEHIEKQYYGIQFHAEVVHTLHGSKIIKNFIFSVCDSKRTWRVEDRADSIIREIRGTVGNDSVIMGVSGGVDSSVAATLIHQAIHEKLYCVFINHGLLRKNEVIEVESMFKKVLKFKHFLTVDASELFLKKLHRVIDPEEKRHIIGHTFIEVFDKTVKELEKKHPRIRFLGQGTIYPDRIESAQTSLHTAKIKSHHNVTLPKNMKLRVIEPLREFYKDEVRTLGRELNIPDELLDRHPFPGPGLAIRILGEITNDRLRILRETDYIFIEELKKTGLYKKVWQAFAALLPIKSVGVMGDGRTYDYVITLRAVTSIDAMTADWAKLPASFLGNVSNRIINEVLGVNRVLYDISQKPPATIEYE